MVKEDVEYSLGDVWEDARENLEYKRGDVTENADKTTKKWLNIVEKGAIEIKGNV